MNEKAATKTLVNNLRKIGCHVQRIEDMFSVGVPDLNFCYRGLDVWLEGKFVKLPKKNNTKLNFGAKNESRLLTQRNWLNKRLAAGGWAFVWAKTDSGKWIVFDSPEVLTNPPSKAEALAGPCFNTCIEMCYYLIQYVDDWGRDWGC